QTPLTPGGGRPLWSPTVPRASALEVAIRASAKTFLSHPSVVQFLEAIWNGSICFCLPPQEPQPSGPSGSASGGNQSRRQSTVRTPLLAEQREQRTKYEPPQPKPFFAGRSFVTLYNPRTTTLFKLS